MRRSEMRVIRGAIALSVLLSAASAQGQANDPARASELAKRGEELLRANRCREAVVVLHQSRDLDPQPGALINLAKCQEQLRRYTEALRQLAAARSLAREQRQTALETRIAALASELDARTPRVMITFAPGTPDDVVVRREKDVLPASSFERGVPLDPGDHVLEVSARGRMTKPYPLHLDERERRAITLTVGDVAPAVPEAPAAAPPDEKRREVPVAPPAEPTASSGLRTTGFVSLAVGAVGLGIGAAFGLVAMSKKSDAQNAGCRDAVCPDAASRDLRESARDSGNVATVATITGGVFALAGIGMVLLAPKTQSSAVGLSLGPLHGGGMVGAKTSW